MAKKVSKKKLAARKKEERKRVLTWVGIGAVIIVGFLAVVLLSSGGSSPQQSALPASISVDEAYAKYQEGAYVLDVRTQEEWDSFHAPEATLIPLDELPQRVNEVPKDQEVVVVCRSGNRSQAGRDILMDAGYTQVTSMNGGMNDWANANYPIVSGP